MTVTVLALVMAIAAPWLRSVRFAELGAATVRYITAFGPLTPILLIVLALACGLLLVPGIAAIRCRRTSAALRIELVAHGIGMLVVALLLVAVVPRFEKTFKEFEVPLPAVTRHLVIADNAVVRYAYLLLPLMAALVVVDVVIFRRLYASPGGRPWAKAWSAAITVTLLMIVLFSAFALFAPLFCVIHKLTGDDC